MEELFQHHFRSGWGDFQVITVYKEHVKHEIINWGDVEFEEPSWRSDNWSHEVFYSVHQKDDKMTPVIDFLLREGFVKQ